MAKTDIANLNVRLTASTSEFTAGMANAQRRLEQTTAVVTKSRAAFSGLGSAMRMPGLGRGAALGGAASGVAGALGIGALSGGVVGLTATGSYLLIDWAIRKERELKEAAVAARNAIQDRIVAIRAGIAAAGDMYQGISRSIERNPTQRRLNEIQDTYNANVGMIRARIDEIQALMSNPTTGGYERYDLQQELQRAVETWAALTKTMREDTEEVRKERADRLMLGRVRAGLAGADRFSISDAFSTLANAQRAARDAAAMRAEADEETARAIRDAVADWKRENQNASDLLATTVGRISSQITQLTYRSN